MNKADSRIVVLGLLTLVTSSLVGCAGLADRGATTDPRQMANWTQRGEALEQISEWRLVARAEVDTGRGFYPFTLVWRADADEDVIDASGPGGQGGGRLILRAETADLRLRSGERFSDADADRLAAELLGVEIPVRATRDWLRAIPRGNSARLVFDTSDQLTSFQDGDWMVRYLAYARSSADVSEPLPLLPADLLIENRRIGVEIRVREARWFLRLPSGDGTVPTRSGELRRADKSAAAGIRAPG